jgi:hypothetical protein
MLIKPELNVAVPAIVLSLRPVKTAPASPDPADKNKDVVVVLNVESNIQVVPEILCSLITPVKVTVPVAPTFTWYRVDGPVDTVIALV